MKKGGLDQRYYDVKRHPSSQKFHDFCDQMKALHDKKQSDYGRKNDPFANVRATEDWGQPAWVGAMIRATDKLKRLQKAAQGGTMANESVEDSFMDLAVYSIIGLCLYLETIGTPIERAQNEYLQQITVPGAALRVSE